MLIPLVAAGLLLFVFPARHPPDSRPHTGFDRGRGGVPGSTRGRVRRAACRGPAEKPPHRLAPHASNSLGYHLSISSIRLADSEQRAYDVASAALAISAKSFSSAFRVARSKSRPTVAANTFVTAPWGSAPNVVDNRVPDPDACTVIVER